ncbi:ABC transporter permease [Coprococcus comes]|uniref:ABC transporter permease n=1 Tax=Coprococcus comes TaxID=410072 RepID=A0A3E4GRG1_9FIRM|nr:ABC transporter permease [Coprococcus comes]RGJ24217.1 ABC transporter permease [Coprococcus comes]
MIKMILKRIFQLIPVLLITMSMTFVITRVLPGNPAVSILGPQATAEDIAKMEEEMGLHDPMPVQYINYMKRILTGDLGTSYRYNRPVADLIFEKLPNTLQIALASLIIALLIGVPVGIISAVKQYSAFDYISMIAALIGVSMPSFWLGLMLVLVFSVNLGWFPTMGMGVISNGIGDVISHLFLPSLCLSFGSMANFARISRSSMLEVIDQDYMKAVRAKGIRENVVIIKHGLKNALPPIVTVLGMRIAALMTGAIMIETIFSWPGIGRLIVDAINNNDFEMIQGTVLFMAILYVTVNLVVDIIYLYINPKVSYESERRAG